MDARRQKVFALDRELAERLAARCARLAEELPSLRPGAPPAGARYRVETGSGSWVAEVWPPDAPPVATTLRIGLAPLDAAGDPAAEAEALAAVVDHLFRTTAAARLERAVAAGDARRRAACERAGLACEGVRRSGGLVDRRPADIAVYAALRGGIRTGT